MNLKKLEFFSDQFGFYIVCIFLLFIFKEAFAKLLSLLKCACF